MTPDNLAKKEFGANLTRREFLKLIAAATASVFLRPEFLDQQEKLSHDLLSIDKHALRKSEAESILETSGVDKEGLIIQKVNLSESEDGILVPDIKLEEGSELWAYTQAALEAIKDAESFGGNLNLNIIYESEVNQDAVYIKNQQVGIMLKAENDFEWLDSEGNPVSIKKDSEIFIDREGLARAIVPSKHLGIETNISITKLDRDLVDKIKQGFDLAGYNRYHTLKLPELGSWVVLETDLQGQLIQVRTKDASFYFVSQMYQGTQGVRIRKTPDTTTNENILENSIDNNIIVDPTLVPPALREDGVVEDEENRMLVKKVGVNEWVMVMTKDGKIGWTAGNLITLKREFQVLGIKIDNLDEKRFKTLEEIYYFDSGEAPWERYGITEEEYRRTKETVTEYTPQEVIDEAEGKYSHELRGYVKIMDGKVFVWRPGMGQNVESGWVTTLDTLIIPELGINARLEGNPTHLANRTLRGQEDLSRSRFNHDEELINRIIDTFKDHPRFRMGNPNNRLFIQIASDMTADVYKTITWGYNTVANGYKPEKKQNYVLGRILYEIPSNRNDYGNLLIQSYLSEDVLFIFMAYSLGYGGELVKLKPVVGGFVNEIESVVKNVIGDEQEVVTPAGTKSKMIRERHLVLIG